MSDSELEALFDAHWRNHAPDDLPDPEHEAVLIPGRKLRCDRVWREARLVVEIDGGQWASRGGRHNTDGDREKLNLLVLHGWRVLRYSGTMLQNDPLKVIAQIEEALHQ